MVWLCAKRPAARQTVRREKMNRNKTKFFSAAVLILCLAVSVLIACAEEEQKHNYKPEEGYVPDAETAIKIAVAVWIPIYGEEQIEGEKPYSASLKDGIWYVAGSLPQGGLGGVAEAEIAKESGCILRISHGE
jgi:hypothetical protein